MNGSNLLTNSRLQTLRRCPFQHWVAFELGIRPDRDSEPLRMGTAFHVAQDAYAKTRDVDASVEAIYLNYDNVPEWADAFDWSIEREKVLRLFCGHVWRWAEDGIQIIHSEKSFRLPLLNPETGKRTPLFDRGGKVDRIVTLADGRKALHEFKTTGDSVAPDSDYWDKLRLDSQVSFYFDATDVETILYDVTHKPGIEPKQITDIDANGKKIVLDASGQRVFKKNGEPRESGDKELGYTLSTHLETVEEYGQRLADDIVARPDFYFARREVPRLTKDMEMFRQDLWWDQQLLRQRQLKSAWPKWSGEHCNYCAIKGPCFTGFDFASGAVPDGFVQIENCHPELNLEEINEQRSTNNTAAGSASDSETGSAAVCQSV